MASKAQTDEFIKSLELVGGDPKPVKKAWELVENLSNRAVLARQHMSSLRPDAKDYTEQSQAAALTWSALESQVISAGNDLDQAIADTQRKALAEDLPAPFKARLEKVDNEILGQLFNVAEQLRGRHRLCQEFDQVMGVLCSWAVGLGLEQPGVRPGIGDEPIGNSPHEHFKKYMARFARAFSYAQEKPGDLCAWFYRHRI